MSTRITGVEAVDQRYTLHGGEGSDAIHTDPRYSYAVTLLHSDRNISGTGLALTLGTGNELVCAAIAILGGELKGLEIEELMADFGSMFHRLAEHSQLRWLGPHKGVVHLALASITNACFDLWAISRGVPLWRLLLDLTPEQVVNLLDLSYVEDVLPRDRAVAWIEENQSGRAERERILRRGYPAYDTSVGWFGYEQTRLEENARRSVGEGFHAVKLKVGSAEGDRDVRRAEALRRVVGDDVSIMVDVNQQWPLDKAIKMGFALAPMSPYWIEEPTHPDDVLAHQTIARAIHPIPVALGEHVPNRILFKNFLQAGAAGYVQADCTRLGGVSEWITVSLLARNFGVPVAPHAGEMGQIHQHLVLFQHIALGAEISYLEYIPHLREHFLHPLRVEGGYCRPPDDAGIGAGLKGVSSA